MLPQLIHYMYNMVVVYMYTVHVCFGLLSNLLTRPNNDKKKHPYQLATSIVAPKTCTQVQEEKVYSLQQTILYKIVNKSTNETECSHKFSRIPSDSIWTLIVHV